MATTNITLSFLSIMLALSLAGCGHSVPKASIHADTKAKRINPENGKSLLYVIRKGQFEGSAFVLSLDLDESPFANLSPGTFAYAQIPPGKHKLHVTTDQQGFTRTLVFKTEPNRINYYSIWFGVGLYIQEVSESEGIRKLNDSHLTAELFSDL